MWLTRRCEHYFVPMEETRAHLAELGVPAERITVSGIPIDPAFARPADKAEMRRKHGLEPDRTTILVSAGGFGVGKPAGLVDALSKLQHPAQILAICGKNEELRAELAEHAANLPADARISMKVIGYTTQMDELMAASDFVVGKPGGLTTSEALARGLIYVVVNPIPGQEERNSDHLLEEGAAIRCNNLPVLAYKIDQLLEDPARMACMKAAALQMAKPEAARTIVTKLVGIGLDDREGRNHV